MQSWTHILTSTPRGFHILSGMICLTADRVFLQRVYPKGRGYKYAQPDHNPDQDFIPGQLNYSIPNEPQTVHDVLTLENSRGTFFICVWDENTAGGGGIDVVNVNLGGTYGPVFVYDPTVGTSPVASYASEPIVVLMLSQYPEIIMVN